MATRSGPDSLPVPGSRLAHYEVEAELGRGGMGVVFRARDVALHRPVALKSPLALDPDSVRRFLSEARAASQLSSPYIVGVHEVFEAEGRPWMAMEYVQGESLRQRLKRQGPPPLEDALRWALHLAEALQVAHQHKLLHRDINPKNVLVDDQGRARLTDFGLAKAYADEDEVTGATTRVSLTRTGAMVGTRGYMSPEQVLGRALDPRTDIFSLGATLYELCSGCPAFRRTESGDALDAILYRDPPPLADVLSEAPPELDRILRRALAKKPEERYPSAASLRADLQALRRTLEFESYGHDIVVETTRSRLRWRRGALALLAVVVVAIALSVRPWQWGGPPPFDPMPTRSLAMVTWPYVESESRISPDEQWVSFVSERGGEGSLWVRRVSGGEPHPVDTGGGMVLGHAWSPDGEELAVLHATDEGGRVDFVTAPLGSWPSRSVTTDAPRIVGWIGDRLYLERAHDGTLWSLQVGTGDAECVAPADEDFDFRRDFAVRDDAQQIAFAGVRAGVEQVWVTGTDGSGLRAVTSGDAPAYAPRWMGRDRLLYLSNRGQQQGMWTVDLRNGRHEQIPFGQPVPFLEDVSRSGRRATVQSVREEAHLWRWRPGAVSQRLTADTLGDFSSSFSWRSAQLAFARSLPGRKVGSSFLDTSIELADLTDEGLTRIRTVVDEGTAPCISPDGRYLAYLRRSKTPPYFTDLRVKDLDSLRDVLVSPAFQYPGAYSGPPEWVGWPLAWSDDGSRLYFAAGDDRFVSTVLVASAPDFAVAEPIHQGESRALVLEVKPRPDGSALLVTHGPQKGSWVVLRAANGSSEEFYRPTQALSSLSLLEAGEDSLLVLQATLNEDYTERLSLITRRDGAQPIERVSLPSCALRTSRWQGPWLYVVTVTDGIHDVVRANAGTGQVESVERNDLPGVTFSCIQPLPNEHVLYSRQVVNADIWLLEFSPPDER